MVTVEHVLTAGHWGGAGLRMTFCVCHFPCYCISLFLSISGALIRVLQVMQKHQRYFAMTDEDGKLLPYFITVRNPYYLVSVENSGMLS